MTYLLFKSFLRKYSFSLSLGLIISLFLISTISPLFVLQVNAQDPIVCKSFSDDPLKSISGKTEQELKKTKQSQVAELRHDIQSSRENLLREKRNLFQKNESVKALLEQRKEKLLQLFHVNPDAALAEVRSDKSQSLTNLPTQNCLETVEKKRGELTTVEADYFRESVSDTVTIFHTTNKENLSVTIAGRQISLPRNTKEVALTGYVVDTAMLVDAQEPSNVQVLSVQDSTMSTSSNPATSGTKTLAVVVATTAIGVSDAQNQYATVINDYLNETSFGNIEFSVTTYGPVSVETSCSVRSWDVSAQAAIDAAGISQSQFDNVAVVGDFNNCGWAGIAFSPGKLSAMRADYLLTLAPAHELAHNYWISHANFNNVEYGDKYSVMGDHYNKGMIGAPTLEFVDWWYASTNLQTVTESGTYTLEPLETASTGLKAIKILRGDQQPLYVEYRQPIGTDTNLQNVTGTNVFTGGLIHIARPVVSSMGTDLIDVSPPADVVTPALQVGETYTDPVTNVTITAQSRTSSSLTLQVTFPVTSATVTLTPTDDTYVDATTGYKDTNYGTANPMYGTYTSRRGFLRFTPNLPTNAVIDSVSLELYPTANGSSGGFTFHPLVNTWSETTLTWNNQPTWDNTILATSTSPVSGTWIATNLPTSVVTGPTTPINIGVKYSVSGINARFSSREDATNKPKLVVTYHTGTSITPTPTPTPTPTNTPTPTPTNTPTPTPTNTPTPTPTPGGTTESILPIADTYVRSDSAGSNYGTSTALQVDGSPIKIIYMKFDLSAFSARTLTNAKLRMRVTDSSSATQVIKQMTDTSWSETGTTYNNRPTLGTSITSISNVAANSYIEIDITGYVNSRLGNLMSLGIDSAGSDGADFVSSNASVDRPSIILQFSN